MLGSIGFYIKDLSSTSCTISMRDSYWVRNPFKCIHAAALVNLGEAATGLAMLAWMESNNYKGIVTRLDAVYYKKARGVIRADAYLNNFIPNEYDDTDVPVKALLTDSTDTVIGNITVYWTIRPLK